MIGKTLAHYEVIAHLGAGGMGEVVRARDTKLGREVALKILPAAFADDPERLARFQREAQLLASLNHPNIAAIHGVEEDDGVRFIVMEVAEGQDLQARLEKGALALDEAVAVALGIAEGLEEAHERGVVHRDLKPGNVMVSDAGKVKILDFGLARAYSGEAPAGGDPALSPTITAAMTVAGTVLGSAAYMSPEQAKGLEVDRRTDIWAFGVILYEMLTGLRLFQGETVSETMAAVLKDPIDLEGLPADIPVAIHALLARCLERDPVRRLRDIGEARIHLDLTDASSYYAAGAVRRPRPRWTWALGGALVTALIAIGAWTVLRPAPPESDAPVRFEVVAATQEMSIESWSLALSPEGRRVAWVVEDGAERAIWLREMEGLAAERLPDTDGAQYPTFSPDGRSIAFYAAGKLRRFDLGSRRAIDLCDARDGAGMTWGPDGTIVFNENWLNALSRVSAEGGPVEEVTRLDETYGEIGHWFPDLLPDGRHVLISRWRTSLNDMNVAVASLETGEIRDIVPRASFARFAPPDRLLFTRAGAIHTVRFDPNTLEVSGEPVVVVDGVEQQWDNGLSPWTVSDDGTLAYLPGSLWVTKRAIVRVNRAGEIEPLDVEPGPYVHATISPDGERLAATEFQNGRVNVVVHDLSRGVSTPVPLDAMNAYPVWGGDGREILFDTAQKGPWDIHRFAVDQGTLLQPLLEDSTDQIPLDWSSDGRFVLWDENYSGLEALDLQEQGKRFRVSDTGAEAASLSPDARWVAYMDSRAGRSEVLVRRFPDGTRDVRVSNEGGSYPLWGRDGREILYRRGDAVLAAAVSISGDEITVDRPRVLFRNGSFLGPARHVWRYDPTTDSLIMIRRGDHEISRDRFVVVLNWTSGLVARGE